MKNIVDALVTQKPGQPGLGMIARLLADDEPKRGMNLPRGSFPSPMPVPTEDDLLPDWDPRMGSFSGGSFQVADLAGINPDNLTGANKTTAQNTAFAYRALMNGLNDFEGLVKKHGGRVMPGTEKDELGTAHRNLQMQMKELYNLGVLNGPDLDLMNEILFNPTSIGPNILEALGGSSVVDRAGSNISQVRKLMTDLAEPKLRALGIDPAELIDTAPSMENMSDDDLLKLLGGS